jgi:predicted MFS family arabinose efflux permease
MNTAISFMNALGPLLGGLIAHSFSFFAVFWVSALMLATSFATVLFFVKEPRARNLFR